MFQYNHTTGEVFTPDGPACVGSLSWGEALLELQNDNWKAAQRFARVACRGRSDLQIRGCYRDHNEIYTEYEATIPAGEWRLALAIARSYRKALRRISFASATFVTLQRVDVERSIQAVRDNE